MKKTLCALTLFAMSSTQSFALSCVAPDVANAFMKASKSDKSYAIFNGRFTLEDEPKSENGEPAEQILKSEFNGKLLTRKGFEEEIKAPVDIELTCAGPWCGQIEADTDYLAFIERRDDKLVFVVGPCYGLAFANPSASDLRRVVQCAVGTDCEPAG